jgi:hypothetical protein
MEKKYKVRGLTLKKRQFVQDLIIDYLAGRTSKQAIQLKYEKKFKVTDNSFYAVWNAVTVDTFYNNFKTRKTDFKVKEDDLKGLHKMPKNWQLLKYKDDLTIKDYEKK